jgi:hypothetical protein
VRWLATALAAPRTVASENGLPGCPACSAGPKRWQATALHANKTPSPVGRADRGRTGRGKTVRLATKTSAQAGQAGGGRFDDLSCRGSIPLVPRLRLGTHCWRGSASCSRQCVRGNAGGACGHCVPRQSLGTRGVPAVSTYDETWADEPPDIEPARTAVGVPLLGTSSAEANAAPGKAVFESWP